MEFLKDHPAPRIWMGADPSAPAGRLFLGRGARPFEIAVAEMRARPSRDSLEKLWEERHGGRPADLLLVVLYREGDYEFAALAGPETGRVTLDLSPNDVEAIAQRALSARDRHHARRAVGRALDKKTASATSRP